MLSKHSQKYFSFNRFFAIMFKEFTQMRRDRLTFAMLIGIPLLQLTLFGFAINTNPKHLPTALLAGDHSAYTRALIRGIENTDYFRITHQPHTENEAKRLLAQNKVLFVINIPSDFTSRLIRGQKPNVLIETDATNGVTVASALTALQSTMQRVLNPLLRGNLASLQSKPLAINLISHAKYNPENITSYYIVPGLLGVVLTMTMVMITSLAMTRERERGTLENLLSTPARPIEVMAGKITPYIIVGYSQVALILIVASLFFHVPARGSVFLLLLCALPFIAANLAMGLTFSSIAKNQLQAVQMAFFFFLPSILLSGFMFPFQGMPNWAQTIGTVLPLTHFLKIARGILLKGNPLNYLWTDLWPIFLFMFVALIVGLKRYRQTLD